MISSGNGVFQGAAVIVSAQKARSLTIGKIGDESGLGATGAAFDVPGKELSIPITVPFAEARVVLLLEKVRIFRCDEHTGYRHVDRITEGMPLY